MLKEILKEVLDFRQKRGQSYELWAILALIILGFLSGRQGLLSVHRMGQSLNEKQRRQLGFIRKMPCHATLTETIRAVNADALAAVLGRVALRCEDNATEQRHIAIDGNTILASKDGEGRAIHCVSAFCQALQQVFDHTASRGKGMEIPDALKLLEWIDLKDKIVTSDAMFCQKALAEKITEGGGNYILPVKKNQKNLLNEVQMAFAEPVFPPRTLV